MIKENTILIIAGPTAVGKTELSLQLAEHLNGEIVSADSVQLYKHMNIGSATPTTEELNRVTHHLINDYEPTYNFTVAEFSEVARQYIQDIFNRGKLPIIVGGTGLYINSLIYDMDFSETAKDEALRERLRQEAEEKGKQHLHDKLASMDPDAAQKIHQNNVKRVVRALEINILTGETMNDFKTDPVKTKDYHYELVCLKRNRKILYARINKRVEQMIEQGLIEEVKKLKAMGLTEDSIAMKAIGYKEVLGYLDGKYDRDMMIKILKKNTRHFAKRQLTWFRRYDDIHWINLTKTSETEAFKKIVKLMKIG
jgi:tRNA dimethylallyltransferase